MTLAKPASIPLTAPLADFSANITPANDGTAVLVELWDLPCVR